MSLLLTATKSPGRTGTRDDSVHDHVPNPSTPATVFQVTHEKNYYGCTQVQLRKLSTENFSFSLYWKKSCTDLPLEPLLMNMCLPLGCVVLSRFGRPVLSSDIGISQMSLRCVLRCDKFQGYSPDKLSIPFLEIINHFRMIGLIL